MSNTHTDNPRRSKKLERLAAEDDRLGRGSASDRAFARNPHRNFRARLATSYEMAALEMMPDAPTAPSGDLFLWVVVRQIAPGFRMRKYAFAPPPVGPRADMDEETVRDLFWGSSDQEGD
jgi:hypothetical protein